MRDCTTWPDGPSRRTWLGHAAAVKIYNDLAGDVPVAGLFHSKLLPPRGACTRS
jgi:hypothetical protein